jgi:hypothetical protein
MPRKERAPRASAILGAAKNYSTRRSGKTDTDSKARGGEEWMRTAWDFFDLIQEYHQGCAIVGALLSRAKLVAMEKGADGKWAPTQNPVALAALDELYGGEEGHSEMLRQFGIHLSVAGGGYLIGPSMTEGATDPDDWQVAATTEVTRSGGTWRVNGKPLKGKPMVIYIWKPHPRNKKKADAPSRALLGTLSELLQLRKRIAAQIDSRLTGAGMMLVPSETSFPSAPVRQLNAGDPAIVRDSIQPGNAQGLADLLFERMQIAIEDPSSAEAMMPLIGETPGEFVDKVKVINFWSELDKAAPALRRELVTGVATGMDMPPEVLLGNAGSNHWNAWLSDENNVKIHAEPLLHIVTSSITTGYYRVALDGEPGIDDPNRFAIMADTSAMRMRPNRSKEALELHRELILGREAVARENGFEPSDLMTDEERAEILRLRAASGSTTPEIVEAALEESGVDLDVQITDSRPPVEARPLPSIRQHPVRELPQRPNSNAAELNGLVMACEQMVDRALQRAGNRIKTKFSIKEPPTSANRLYLHAQVERGDLDHLLADAWECVRLDDYGVDAMQLERVLDMYTRAVILSRREPSRASLRAALQLLPSSRAA